MINNNTSDSLFFDLKIGSYASGNYTLEFENFKAIYDRFVYSTGRFTQWNNY
ncbi:MAG: hypothetical protein CM15mP65_26510 [Crocinitomicaceae bacterium]|nr:MAG: hypothetical protein CM15mP65_26510 [Crocinitomicaceae bacterium]